MDKELIELFEAARKAADAAAAKEACSDGSEETRCLDALKRLKNFPVTKNALIATQVGKRVRQLTKHPKAKIQAVASDLVETWKKVVIEETTGNKKNGNSEDKSSAKVEKGDPMMVEKVPKVRTPKAERIDQGERIKSEKASFSETVKVEKIETVKVEKSSRSEVVKVEKISKEEKQASGIKKPPQTLNGPPKLTSMIKCNDAMRDKLRENLAEAFSRVSNEVDEDIRDEVNAYDPIRVAVSVESALFEKWGRSNGAQKFKYRSIMFNIQDPKNPDLRRRVLLGQIKPERLLVMTPNELASDQRRQENNQIKEKALFECERGGAPKATTDQFRCGRCGQRKCTYHQMQTRSADEPMTTYVTCVNCNNHWKFC
ncbi:transcription elongation factor TFIIS-like isoform X3 [Telopea speciosissima]|uniref:transcription elongation factor TFIIS-like isoform X3 n=1 Tax=Telopea speciosissima TaxID=54955 RepID=UPI001CC6B74A|nr:transcription elongation factor TFIIS-like isoform X3 [Telopea speciosissima]